jgi:hypothetical protein
MTIFLSLLILPIIVLSSIWRGYVLTILWAWFIVPVFHLPALGIVAAIGFSLMITFLTYHHQREDQADTRSAGEQFGQGMMIALIWPLIYLGMGYLIQLFL